MQVLARHRSSTADSFAGERRGFPDLARFALDLNWARAEPESAASSGGYPPPPMSGSPPVPPKTAQEAGERGQHTYLASSQDAYRGGAAGAARTDPRLQAGPPAPVGSYPSGPPERNPYAFHHAEDPMQRPLPYAQPPPPPPTIPPHPYLPVPGPGHGLGPGPAAAGYPQPMPENPPPYASPKRKAKGHVASACVPCKRAHLRCDAQRPCSRCRSNGKEDSCVDVQHKKRGRPRLRDDREVARFDTSRFGHPAADPPMTRAPSLYAPQGPVGPTYDDPFRRTQSYRVLKSQPPEAMAPRFVERGLAGDAGAYPPPLSVSTRAPPEPAAFLTMDLVVARASSTFRDAIGRPEAAGRKLAELLVAGDRDRVAGHQRQLQDEQAMREPNYLPPIFGRQEEERVMQGLGFGPDEMSRYALERQEYLTFSALDGHPRMFDVRMGLAKQDSIYFVVLLLNLAAARPFQHPTPSPQLRDPRDPPYPYPVPQQQPYSQPTPVSATFDPRARLGADPGYGRRPSGAAGQPLMPGLGAGLPSSYAPSPSRPDYAAGPSYQIPRSELPEYQLPPIRSQHQQQQQQPAGQHNASPREQAWPREERQRVDIGGLIDKPDASRRPR